jgi:DNA-binding PadR family transcriptional regulator
MLVMKLLADAAGGMYGLEIVEASKGAVKRGSVYVLLGRLEVNGFVKSTTPKVAPDHAGLPRPTYRLTAVGMRVLAAAEDVGLAFGV